MNKGINLNDKLRGMDPKKLSELKEAYYGVSDHIGNLFHLLEAIDTKQGDHALDALESFNNIEIGKHI